MLFGWYCNDPDCKESCFRLKKPGTVSYTTDELAMAAADKHYDKTGHGVSIYCK